MFYRSGNGVDEAGRRLVDAMLRSNVDAGLTSESLAVTLVVYSDPERPQGFAHNGDRPFYPCSVVKMFWMAACLHRIEEGAVSPHPELERAMHDMIRWSSNTATNYIIDLVTGTTGDILLEGGQLEAWCERRSWANRWIRSFGWPEVESINVCQKNMDDDRYGREHQLVDSLGHNSLTANATARLFHEIFYGTIFSEAVRRTMQDLLYRPHDRGWAEADPRSQVNGFFGAGLPSAAQLWSKSGWTGWTGDPRASYRRHDAARIAVPDLAPFILVIFTEGRGMSDSQTILPGSAAAAIDILRQAGRF